MSTLSSNFTFQSSHDLQLVRFGTLAERYFKDDPSTCLIKLRQFGEVLALLDRLDQDTAEAFRSELVPQDPDDEPGSILGEHFQ